MPALLRTWLIPGVLVSAGLVLAIVGLVLLLTGGEDEGGPNSLSNALANPAVVGLGGPLLDLEVADALDESGLSDSQFDLDSGIRREREAAPSDGGGSGAPFLGVFGDELTPDLAEDLGLGVDVGLYVLAVAAGGPAEAAGLVGAFPSVEATLESVAASGSYPPGGDVITHVDGEALPRLEQLASFLGENYEVGDTVRLTVVRGGDEVTVRLTLGEPSQ